jgi:D-alanyl-D-alanine carboxypeptidase (penicillin-binding protein 5/6)
MFVALGSRVKVEDLIRGIAVQSGNDACKVVAEGIAGSEAAFVEMMNKKAQEMGLDHSHFTNSDGMEDPEHQMTARDIVKLAARVYADFPEYYHYFAEKEFVYNGIKQGNRNPLLYKNMGVDGLKTGHLQVAGFGLIASAERNGRRIFLLVDGLPSMQLRSDESVRLLDWAFQSFQNVKLASAGDTLAEAPVWYGSQDSVALTVAKDLIATLPKKGLLDLRAKAVFPAPIPAPITAGQTLGRLVITTSGSSTEVPLVAGTTVQKVGFLGHALATLRYLVLPPSYHVAEQ